MGRPDVSHVNGHPLNGGKRSGTGGLYGARSGGRGQGFRGARQGGKFQGGVQGSTGGGGRRRIAGGRGEEGSGDDDDDITVSHFQDK